MKRSRAGRDSRRSCSGSGDCSICRSQLFPSGEQAEKGFRLPCPRADDESNGSADRFIGDHRIVSAGEPGTDSGYAGDATGETVEGPIESFTNVLACR